MQKVNLKPNAKLTLT